jgi:hypothetical protein
MYCFAFMDTAMGATGMGATGAQATQTLVALLAKKAELEGAEIELRDADVDARAGEEEGEFSADHVATVALLRSAAHTMRELETHVCHIEAEGEAEAKAELGAGAESGAKPSCGAGAEDTDKTATMHVRIQHILGALAAAVALRRAGSAAMSESTTAIALSDAVRAGDYGRVALGLVLRACEHTPDSGRVYRQLLRFAMTIDERGDRLAYLLTFPDVARAAGDVCDDDGPSVPSVLHFAIEQASAATLVPVLLKCKEITQTAGDFTCKTTPLIRAIAGKSYGFRQAYGLYQRGLTLPSGLNGHGLNS